MMAISRVSHIRARNRFFRVTGTDRRWDREPRRDMNQALLQINAGVINQVSRLIGSQRKHHRGISEAIIRVINRGDSERCLSAVVAHFDYTHSLGWDYQGDVITLIEKVIGPHREALTREQERALIALEDSHWDKEYVCDKAYLDPQYAYDDFVSEVVLSRPHDIDQIIAIVQTTTVHHAGHLDALLDGYGANSLAEGAL